MNAPVVAECWTCAEAACDCKGDGSRMIDDLTGEDCAHGDDGIPLPLVAGQAEDDHVGHDVRPVQS